VTYTLRNTRSALLPAAAAHACMQLWSPTPRTVHNQTSTPSKLSQQYGPQGRSKPAGVAVLYSSGTIVHVCVLQKQNGLYELAQETGQLPNKVHKSGQRLHRDLGGLLFFL
jgi:hypothetical protein